MLCTDAARTGGLGYALLQCHGHEDWKLVQCGSRFLSDVESRYACIEMEMAGVVWAIKKCHLYLVGMPHFDVIVDHRPLVPVLNSKLLSEIENSRLQRMREKLTAYTFTATWRKGSCHQIPDALSRAPVADPSTDDEVAEVAEPDPLHLSVITALTAIDEDGILLAPLQDQTLEKVRAAASRDPDYTELRDLIIHGFPDDKHRLSPSIRPYWNVRDKLAIDDGLIVYGPRLLIPQELRKETLERLHDGHQGINATCRRARQTVYWPRCDSDIKDRVESCSSCNVHRSAQPKEPLWQDDSPPTRVFESVSVDYFHYGGRTYFIYVDRLSGWPYVTSCPRSASAAHLVTELRALFAATGVPVLLRSDGGPQFSSSLLRRFLTRWGVEHRMSSPHHHQSNGHAEAAVKKIKNIVRKATEHGELDSDEFARALLEMRNTPRSDGRSPAQVLFGHPMRTTLPAHHRAFAKEWQEAADVCDARAAELRKKAKLNYDASATPLAPLAMGAHVDVRDMRTGQWDRTAVVVGVGKRRDYLVKFPSGRIWWRNRRYLRRHHPLIVSSHVGKAAHPPPRDTVRPVDRQPAVATDRRPPPRDDVRPVDRRPPVTTDLPAPSLDRAETEPEVRRSGRVCRRPDRLQVRWDADTYM